MRVDTVLTPEEVRVLGSLMEKELSTPEYYPLTLNALLAACNQKTSRDPVVLYDEKLVLGVLEGLRERRLVWQSDSGRVSRYEELFVKNSRLDDSEAAVLCVLMLRGLQTAGEIKAHTERLFAFDSVERLNETLDALAEAGYIVKAPRQPGRKESRYAHLLSGQQGFSRPESATSFACPAGAPEDDERIAALEEEIRSLRRDFDDLRLTVAAFMEQFK
jgi:uncharacterized protein